jgi:hypothetical protein
LGHEIAPQTAYPPNTFLLTNALARDDMTRQAGDAGGMDFLQTANSAPHRHGSSRRP